MTNEELRDLVTTNTAALASNIKAIAANAEQHTKNNADIEAMLEGVSQLATSIERLKTLVQANSQTASANAIRFDVLSDDARADRKKADADRAAWKAGFTEQMNEMRLARERSDQRFEAMLAQLDRTTGRVEALEKAS